MAACGGASDPVVDSQPVPDVPADAGNCFGAGLVRVCLPSLPTEPHTFTGALDTDGLDCIVDQGRCVLAGTMVQIASLRVTGSRPAVFVATDSIAVDTLLDVASHGGVAGAAANASACVPAQTASQDGGGAGGTFGARGGNGGVGSLNSAESALDVSVTAFRGGCPGATGAGTNPGAGGASGGAVYLIARARIAVAGSINASGAPGGGGQTGGGGGGGSGGMVGLEAPMVSVTGAVFANGGGGGEGGPAGGAGTTPAMATSPAAGGTGGGGGDGGAGSAGTTKVGGRGGDAASGGGGGGGGAGVIVVIPTQVTGGVLSPAPL